MPWRSDSVSTRSRKKLVLFHQVDLFGHPAQKKTQFFQGRKWFADVIVGAKLHRLHSGFNGAMASHHRNLAARQEFLHFLQKLKSGHVRHNHVRENHVRGLFFKQSERGLAAVSFHAGIAEGFPHSHAQTADALLIVNDQQTNA